MEQHAKDQPPTLQEQIKSTKTYLVHAAVETNLLKMHQTLITGNSAAALCLIDEKLIPKESHPCIVPIDDIMLRSATKHRLTVTEMIKLYIRLRDTIFPYYFGFITNVPLKILASTSFIDEPIKVILQTKQLIYPIDYRPLQIIVRKDLHFLAIQQPQRFGPCESVKDSVKISVAKKTTIAPMTERLVLVTTPVDGFMSLQNNPRIHERNECLIVNAMQKSDTTDHFTYGSSNSRNRPSAYRNI